MTDVDTLAMYRSEALDQRHDLERILEVNDRFRENTESLAKILTGGSADEFVAQNLALQKEMESEEYRFLEWRDGDKVWNQAIHTLTFSPGAYQQSPEAFAQDALEASIIFDKMIRDRLRDLYRTNDHIEMLSDEPTARKLTRVDPAERPKLSQRIKKIDEVADVAIKWGGRVVSALPHVLPYLEKIRHLGSA
jgi:hypothetical protein